MMKKLLTVVPMAMAFIAAGAMSSFCANVAGEASDVLACRCPASIIRARINSSSSWRKRDPQRRDAKLAPRDSRRASDARATRPDAPELTQTGGF